MLALSALSNYAHRSLPSLLRPLSLLYRPFSVSSHDIIALSTKLGELRRLKDTKAFASFIKEVDASSVAIVEGEGSTVQDIANTANSLARLNVQAPLFFKAVNERGAWMVESSCTPAAVANTAWAFAKSGFQAPLFFAAVEKRGQWLADHMNPQELNILHNAALTQLNLDTPTLTAAFERKGKAAVDRKLRENKDGNVTKNLLKMLGENSAKFRTNQYRAAWRGFRLVPRRDHAKVLADDRFKRFVEKTERKLSGSCSGSFSLHCEVLYAVAKLGMKARDVSLIIQGVKQRRDRIGEDGGPKVLSNTLFAIAALELVEREEELVLGLWNKAMGIDPGEWTDPTKLSQLYMVWLCLQIEGGEELKGKLMGVSCGLKERIEDATWFPQSHRKMSPEHMEISKLLTGMGFEHENEVSLFDRDNHFKSTSFLSIDMACRAKKVAIEFNGKQHYHGSNGGGGLNAQSKMKRRLLEKMGWKAVAVSFIEWERLKGGGAKGRWLRGKLGSKVGERSC